MWTFSGLRRRRLNWCARGSRSRWILALLIGVSFLMGAPSKGSAEVLSAVLAGPLYAVLDPSPTFPARVRTTLALSNPNPVPTHVELVLFGADEERRGVASQDLSPFETALIELGGFVGGGVGPFLVFSSGPPLAGVVLYRMTDSTGATSGTAADPLQALASTHLVVPLWQATPDGNPATILDSGFETFLLLWNPNPFSVFARSELFLSDETAMGDRGLFLTPFDWEFLTIDELLGGALPTDVVATGSVEIHATGPVQGLVVTRTPEGDLYAYSPLLGPFGGPDAPVLLSTFLSLSAVLTP